MAAIVIEFARFTEVRNRRARVAEVFAHSPNGPAAAVQAPEANHDRTVEAAGIALAADPNGARKGVDVG